MFQKFDLAQIMLICVPFLKIQTVISLHGIQFEDADRISNYKDPNQTDSVPQGEF